MNTTRWTQVAVGGVAALVSTGALAQPPDRPHDRFPFQQMDADSNGKVTFEEAAAVWKDLTQDRFDKMDANGDGVWTLKPGGDRPGPGGPRGPMKNPDTDGDGKVTAAEFAAARPDAPADLFSKLDKNSDGVLTDDERPARPPHGGPRGPMKNPDADGDGKVTAAEFAAAMPDAPADLFAKLDANGDGVLSEDERPSGPPHGGPGHGPEHGPGHGPDGGRGDHMRAADTNHDGQITFEEAVAADATLTQEQFKARDHNGDGVWSRADRPEGGPERGYGPPVE